MISDTSKIYIPDSQSDINLYSDKIEFYLYIIKELHKYIAEHCFHIKDTDGYVDKLKTQTDELAEKFTSLERPRRLEHFFAKYINIVSSHVTKSMKFAKEKETEFKNIINILTDGISSMNSGNLQFNTNITEHSTKLKNITLIEDIIQIKNGLELELNHVNNVIKKKTEQDIGHLRMLSSKVSTLNEDLKRAELAAMTDKLTGIFNRFAFDDHINKLVEKMSMRLSSLSVLMIDIDNFKQINDTYGHLVGDRAIIAMVQNCKTILRKNDFMARYGGEEFVVILEGSPLKIAQRKANEICKIVSSSKFVIDKKRSNETISFTVSIGIGLFKNDDTALTLIDRADKALYKAKTIGKNRVVTEKEL